MSDAISTINPFDDEAGAFQGSEPGYLPFGIDAPANDPNGGKGFAGAVYENFAAGAGEEFMGNYGAAAQQELQGIQQGAQDVGLSLAQQSATAGYDYGGAQAAAGQNYGAQLAAQGAAAEGNLNLLGQQLYGAQTGIGDAAGQYGLGQAANVNAAGQAGSTNLANLGAQMYKQGTQAAGRQVASVDPNAGGMYRQFAGETAGALGGLERTEGPSAAQAQLQSGINRAQAGNLAMARSGRGWGGSAQALSAAQVQNAQAGQEAANQSAALRAQENAAWRQRQASALGQSANINMGLSQQAQQGQMNAANVSLQQQAQNDQLQAALYGQALQGAGQSAQIGLQGATSAAGVGQQAYGQQLGAYQSAGNAATQNIQAAHAAGMQGTQAGGALALQGLGQGAGTTLGGLGQAGAQYAQGQQTALAAEGMQGQIEGAYQQYEQQELQNYLQAAGIEQGVAIQNAQSGNQLIGAGVGALGTLVGAFSDERLKTDIAEADADVLDLLDKAPGYTYRYKNPDEAGAGHGQFLGPMAQDLEKSELGSSMVITRPDGKKMVDTGRAGLVALGGLSALRKSFNAKLDEELDDLRKQIKSLKKGKAA